MLQEAAHVLCGACVLGLAPQLAMTYLIIRFCRDGA